MSKRVSILSMLMLVMLSFTASFASADGSGITDVVRNLPDTVTPNTEFTVILEIEGDSPSVAGIVENIPSVLSFPDEDSDISSSCDFVVDRENGTIAFSAIGVNTISYNLVSSSTGVYDFSGEWVDLLYQDVEIDDLAERLEDISGDDVLEVAVMSSGKSVSSSGSGGSSSLSIVSTDQAEKKENVSDEAEQSLKSTPESSGNDDAGEEQDSGISTNASIAGSEGAESSVNSTPGFEFPLSCLAFVMSLAVISKREKR